VKRLDVIRKEPSWRRRHKLIENQHPGLGTPLEPFFAECNTALELSKAKEGPAVNTSKEMLAAIGLRLVENIQAGKWWHIDTLGRAVRAWSDSRQRPASDRDKIRAVLVQLFGMFPPGWCKQWVTGVDPKTKRIISRGLPGTVREGVATRDVIANLQPPPEMDKENLRRTIQLVAKEMGYSLDDTPATKTKKKVH